jgi:Tol biopolymer transport system component/tRNA A-37 threonylcarbamoyl transferase component Bud32
LALAPGTRLGDYDVIALIGEGGMGQVWRARDPKLNREVALKVLPDSFANDPIRLARFTREAQTLAVLNHPNIAHLYGIEEVGDVRALVMELVEGEDLAERLRRGPIPLEDALPIAQQIAEALEAAHDSGVIHRDLKPANVKVRPDGAVKVLDFGLAKAKDQASSAGEPATPLNIADSPTVTAGMTLHGAVIGTAAYMAPEQARGKVIDRRVDIWAFGCVLIEMLTGRAVFKGDGVQDVLARVLRQDVNWAALPSNTPPRLRRLLERCLDRDPRKRLRDAGEARIEIATIAAGVGPHEAPVTARPATPSMRVLPWAVAAVAIAAAVMLWAPWRSEVPVDRPIMRLNVNLGPDATVGEGGSVPVAISPDGTRIAFPVRGPGGKTMIATRLLDQSAITPVPGTEAGNYPFFSPDGRSIGFVAESKLKTVAVNGGSPAILSDASAYRGASWGPGSEIIATLLTTGGLRRVSAASGAGSALTTLGSNEFLHLRPQALPGGNAVLFTASPSVTALADASIQVVPLAAGSKTGEVKTLVTNGYAGRYVATNGSTGHLVFLRQGALYAVLFDPVRLEVSGTPQLILEDAGGAPGFVEDPFDISRDGTLVYHSGTSDLAWPVVWMDSSGQTTPLINVPGRYSFPQFSPDGGRLALVGDMGKAQEIFVYDLKRDAMSRLTFTETQKRAPVWSRDGAHLAFTSHDSTGPRVNWIRADGAGENQVLLTTKERLSALAISPDGKRLAYHDNTPDGDTNIWTAAIDSSDPEHPKVGTPVPFLHTQVNEAGAVFSRDGRWLAYFSNETGRYEIFVKAAPGADGKPGPGKWQVSTEGGLFPEWSPDGRELFYRSYPGSRIMVAGFTAAGGSFSSTRPRVWSDRPIRTVGPFPTYALAPDGQRFAVFPVADPSAAAAGSHVTFVLNFFDELRRKVPAPR